jgi:hypothetical protein
MVNFMYCSVCSFVVVFKLPNVASEHEFAVCDVIVCGKSYISVLHCVLAYKLLVVQFAYVPMGVHLRASFTEQTLLVLACYSESRESNVWAALLKEDRTFQLFMRPSIFTCDTPLNKLECLCSLPRFNVKQEHEF